MDTTNNDSSTPMMWFVVVMTAAFIWIVYTVGTIVGYDQGYEEANANAAKWSGAEMVLCQPIADWSIYWPSAWQTGERYVAPLRPVKKIESRDIPPPEDGAGVTNTGSVLPPC